MHTDSLIDVTTYKIISGAFLQDAKTEQAGDETMKLQGKVALITGAGSGIGRAITTLFVREGARVIATDFFPARLETLANDIRDAGYGTLTTIAGDVCHRADAEHVIEAILRTYGAIDIVVNNAGVTDEYVPVTELRRGAMDVHFDGPMYMCRKAIGPMLAQGKGVIVNIAAASGLFGGRAGVSYTVSQHGVIGLTRSIASHYAAKGIRCNAICPSEVAQQDMAGYKPLKTPTAIRNAHPEDVARVALYLASDASQSVNGEMLVAYPGASAN